GSRPRPGTARDRRAEGADAAPRRGAPPRRPTARREPPARVRRRGRPGKRRVNVAVVLFEDAEELDWAGPWEVLSAWSNGWADAGLLAGRPATTHWGSLELLGELGAEVRPDDRFVDDGEVITAAGVSAGIDMALHLVARLHSPERAREVRRYIQYDPEPPV